AGRLAAHVTSLLAHLLEHVAIADGRAQERYTDTSEITLETEIGHDGGNDARASEAPVLLPAFGDDGEELISVDDTTAFVDDDHAVGVAVERNPDIRPHLAHLECERIGDRAAAFLVDIEPVGLNADGDDFGPKLPQRFRRYAIRRTVSAIDHDAQSFER